MPPWSQSCLLHWRGWEPESAYQLPLAVHVCLRKGNMLWHTCCLNIGYIWYTEFKLLWSCTIEIRHATQKSFKCSNASSFLANSVCTLLLSTEKTTTCVIQAISIMNILEPFVTSSLKLLDFFDTSGDVSTVFLRCKGAVVSLYKRCESSSAWPGWTESAPLHRIHWPSTWLTRIAWQVHTCLTMAFALILNGYASILLYVVLIW